MSVVGTMEPPDWVVRKALSQSYKALSQSYNVRIAAKDHPALKRHRIKPGAGLAACCLNLGCKIGTQMADNFIWSGSGPEE